MRGWTAGLAALAALRVAIPLVALAAEGRDLPGFPRYDYEPLNGDADGYYSAVREFISATGRLGTVRLGSSRWASQPSRSSPSGCVGTSDP